MLFPIANQDFMKRLTQLSRKEIHNLFHSNYYLSWQTSPAGKFTLALRTPSLSHPTIPSLNLCTYKELLCKDSILHNNVFSLFPFLPHITGLLSLNQWGGFLVFFWCLLFPKVAIEGKYKINFPISVLKEATIKHASLQSSEVYGDRCTFTVRDSFNLRQTDSWFGVKTRKILNFAGQHTHQHLSMSGSL